MMSGSALTRIGAAVLGAALLLPALCFGAAMRAEGPSSATLNVTTSVWFGSESTPLEQIFPELSLPEIQAKRNTGLAFSGGGVRSFSLSLGYLRALSDLGLVKDTRYITGISGGSWATAVYTYYRRGATITKGNKVAASDAELLGDVTPPANITLAGLKTMPARCALKLATGSIVETVLENIADPRVAGHDVWALSISELYLQPSGIDWDTVLSLDQNHIDAIKAANPSLASTKFVTPNGPDRPFLVVGSTLLGPTGISWMKSANRSYTMSEGTPLYVGRPYLMNVSYHGETSKPEVKVLGGFVEPFAVGSNPPAPTNPVSGSQVDVQLVGRPYYLADSIGSSSFFAGGEISVLPIPSLADINMQYNYWAAGDPDPVGTKMQYADGGCLENVAIISLIRRRVSNIVAFANFESPMASNATWDPVANPGAAEKVSIDNDISAYFGVGSGMSPDGFGLDVRRNQVFNSTKFPAVAEALQRGQAAGTGAVATTSLTTIENKWWGVEAGFKVNVTWVYLSRCSGWERQLPDDVKSLITPKKDPANPQSVPKSGPFKNFPHFDDATQSSLSNEQANLLRDLAGWTITENVDIFRAALG